MGFMTPDPDQDPGPVRLRELSRPIGDMGDGLSFEPLVETNRSTYVRQLLAMGVSAMMPGTLDEMASGLSSLEVYPTDQFRDLHATLKEMLESLVEEGERLEGSFAHSSDFGLVASAEEFGHASEQAGADKVRPLPNIYPDPAGFSRNLEESGWTHHECYGY